MMVNINNVFFWFEMMTYWTNIILSKIKSELKSQKWQQPVYNKKLLGINVMPYGDEQAWYYLGQSQRWY